MLLPEHGDNSKEGMMTEEYYAHSLEGKPPSEWQRLDEHLKNVAEMARSFAEAFGLATYISGSYTPCLPYRRIR